MRFCNLHRCVAVCMLSAFHAEPGSLTPGLELQDAGMVTGDDEGGVVLVAYAEDIVSSDFSGLDTDAVTMDLLPYGQNVPLENVQVFALLDANANNEIDAGDRIGFYGREEAFSSLLAIDHGTHLEGVDPVFRLDIPEPSG